MTKPVDTAFERHFSEPPVLSVKEGRTHCEACKEPLDPNVMHQCHGNQAYQAPVISSTEITEACPDCKSLNVVLLRRQNEPSYVAICSDCRTFLSGEATSLAESIERWNRHARLGPSGNMDMSTGMPGNWPKWRAGLPGDDERKLTFEVPESWASAKIHPDLTNYQGVCAKCHGGRGLIINADTGESPQCDLCEGTGTIPPTKPEGAQ